MKQLILRLILFTLTLSFLFYGNLLARYGKGYYLTRHYDTTKEKTISGKIIKIEYVNFINNGRFQATQLTIKANTKTYVVHLGPEWYISDIVKLKKGEKITVTGSYIKIDSKYLLIAKELKKDGKIYKFRRNDGTPYWSGYRRNKYRR